MTTRRATYQIQAELKLASQKCQFKQDWVVHCVRFFSQHEQQIKHIPYSYKTYSLGLLYYVIRTMDNSIPLDFYYRNVVQKSATAKFHHIRDIYRDLCWKFGNPKKMDSTSLQSRIVEFLSIKYPLLKGVIDIEKNEIQYSPLATNVNQVNTILFRNLKKYKVCQKKELRQMVRNAFTSMQIL